MINTLTMRSSGLLTILAACLLAGCRLFTVTSAPHLGAETDERIESSFKKTYVYQKLLNGDAVSAVAKEGVVTLTGTVAGEYHKVLAQETAECLPGVTRVENQLETKAEVKAAKADAQIGAKVKLTLQLHRNVNAGKTAVDVQDGIVTLKGEASSLAQKELTAEYAKDIEGVTAVTNEMTVLAMREPAERTGDRMDDASITAQAKTALMAHRSTNSIKTKIETLNGVVTLTGMAKNAAEKSLVTKLVTDIQGVIGVKNQMIVEEAIPP